MSADEFKVVDRRRFNQDGDERNSPENVPDLNTDLGSAEVISAKLGDDKSLNSKPSIKANSSDSKKVFSADNSSEDSSRISRSESSKLDKPTTPTDIDLSSFIVSLATQALMLLGEIPNPDSGEVVVNIEAARQTIDIISLLEDKTKGNLTEDEQHLFIEVLNGLRMAYLSKSR